MDLESSTALYEYSKNQFQSESERFIRLENKATKYLSSLTITISAFVVLIRLSSESFLPPDNFLSWAIFISVVMTFAAMISAWSLIFRSLKLKEVLKMPYDKTLIEYFERTDLPTIYFELAENILMRPALKQKFIVRNQIF